MDIEFKLSLSDYHVLITALMVSVAQIDTRASQMKPGGLQDSLKEDVQILRRLSKKLQSQAVDPKVLGVAIYPGGKDNA